MIRVKQGSLSKFGGSKRRFVTGIAAMLTMLAARHLSAPLAYAGGGSHNVALIVNPKDPDSLAVANAYVELRDVPASNIIYVPWQLDARATTALRFRESLIKPVIKELQKRNVFDHINCFAYSSGFPYLIDCEKLFPGENFPRQARPMTSLTSATYLYQFLLHERSAMFALNSNLYFAATVGGVTPSRAFSRRQLWGAEGEPVDAGGMNYVIATALGITHGHGNKAAEIIAGLRRSASADGSKPRGTIYYMRNDDIRSKARHSGYADAVKELAATGVKGEVRTGVVPDGAHDVAGLTTGQANVYLRNAGVTLLPGALVDNLTSAGGQMLLRVETNPQTRISEYMRLGAAGASGTVVEPFAIAAKFPSPALHVHYARGCTLGEAFYQAVSGPAHLLIVGDPLCQPWATAPKVTVSGVSDGAFVSGDVAINPEAQLPSGRSAKRFELYVDGVLNSAVAPGRSFSLVTTDLADGWHELRVIAIDDTPIEVQGRWVGGVQVKNGVDAVQLVVDQPARIAEVGTLAVRVASTRESDANIMHNGRRIAAVMGGNGKATIDASLLGKGTVELYVVQDGEPPLRSRPVEVEVY